MHCGAKTRAGTPCEQPAGWGTEHPGTGRCKLHGGASLRGHLHPRFRGGSYAEYRYAVYSERARGVVGINDAKVLFDEEGVCQGIVQFGSAPVLDRPQPLRKQDLDLLRQLPGYTVSLEHGKGALIRLSREAIARSRRKRQEIEARGAAPRRSRNQD